MSSRTGTHTILALVIAAAVCPAPERPRLLPHESYVWQRRWTPALEVSLAGSQEAVSGWRVLAGEITAGRMESVRVNLAALRRAGRPVVAVFRMDGSARTDPRVVPHILAAVEAWRTGGVNVTGVEIDHDCPASRLVSYREFLSELRPMLHGLTLSITALPAWLGERHLPALLEQADEAVLQVHAVMNPRRGLFDPGQALAWIRRWSAISPVPFRVALPNYGSRVSWNDAGLVTAIESEVARYGVDEEGRELFAPPQDVAHLLDALRRDPPARLRGFVWFRLPTALDRRAWSLATWHAVMAGRPLATDLGAELVASGIAGTRDLVAVNGGAIDAELAEEIKVRGEGCELADALPPYVLARQGDVLRFRLAERRMLRAGQRQVLGWVRCAGGAYVSR